MLATDFICAHQLISNLQLVLRRSYWLFYSIIQDFRVSRPFTGATVIILSPTELSFRKWPHTRQIPNLHSYLTDCNFIMKMLFSDIYWLVMRSSVLCLYTCTIWIFVIAVCQLLLNEYYCYYWYTFQRAENVFRSHCVLNNYNYISSFRLLIKWPNSDMQKSGNHK